MEEWKILKWKIMNMSMKKVTRILEVSLSHDFLSSSLSGIDILAGLRNEYVTLKRSLSKIPEV